MRIGVGVVRQLGLKGQRVGDGHVVRKYRRQMTAFVPSSPKSIMLAGPKAAGNLLDTCALAGLRLA